MQGDINADASSGNISVQHLKGNLTCNTSFGAQIYEDIDGNISSKASSGNIRIDGSKGRLSLGTTFGHIDGKNVRLNSSSEFRASSGSISVDLLNDLKELRFDLSSSSGNLSVMKDNTKNHSDHSLQVGEGSILIKGISTFGNQKYR